MMKRILSIVLGLLTGFLAIVAGESFMSSLYPLTEGIDIQDKVQLMAAVNNMPLNAFLLLLSIYVIAALAAGAVATLIVQSSSNKISNPEIDAAAINTKDWRPAVICGMVLTLAGIIQASLLAHPTWFIIANAPAYIPAAYLGYLVTRKK